MINYGEALAILLHTNRPLPCPLIPELTLDEMTIPYFKDFKYL